ncbi:MAG: HD domain-containing protein [Thermomicrobiales bacterium]|nr:HD domain-containing protein [Thermomicrobiales bacterium]
MSADNGRARGLISFFSHGLRLKSIPRTGWLDRGVPLEAAESIAEHSFQTALIAWIAAADDPSLDRDRILKLALIHDLPEAIIGDFTPYEPSDIPDPGADRAAWRAFLDRRHTRSPQRTAAKRSAEATAVQTLLGMLQGNAKFELAALWRELEEGLTAEARFVKQSDYLEAWLQSRAYLADDPSFPMASFERGVDETLFHPALIALRDAARQG